MKNYVTFRRLVVVGVAAALAGTLFGWKALAAPPQDRPIRSVLAPHATPKLVTRQFTFTEGPAVDKAGNVFFTDQPNNNIWRYSTDGQLSVFLDKAGRANGLYFDKKGNLLACADEDNQLWSIDARGRVTVLVKEVQGHRLNGPNDLWINPKTGGIYFTDPYYQRDYWTRTAPDPGLRGQYVYYLADGQATPVVAADQLRKPNGIIGTPDGRLLYVADIEANKTYRYQIGPGGQLTNRQLFVEQGSDGMTLDSAGNVYLTGKGVTVYSPTGQQLEHIAIPEEWTGNVCFAGKDRRTLFITASQGIYTVPMRVKGAQ
ncbi:SMP-30/gluconolactonase/LRE family protein [Hymenobacter sp. HSC-4F20]|uniref:SMP-30/gluconolactonase/LRE family protein n=1 Tax=Hymenobacter sp. HSC-4F20 TaxID=2864135 RepID=UPI001C73160A|nr:SMP-30/gluconolactonase/LRE family protein [Hymenobacter sp. HSC-4F20]MBX0292614.1 SMP-30/gluconolactonase/LRE family protein [Hymenobacter sp. HSC-4F20]